MLKKADLAKQFEHVVKQEIQNYQNSLNDVLQSIRDVKISIEQVHNEALENYALIHRQQQSLESRFCDVYKHMDDRFKKHSNQFDDFERVRNNLMDRISLIGSDVAYQIQKNETNMNRMDHLSGNLETIEDEVRGFSLGISATFENIRVKLSKELLKMKEEILSKPSEAIAMKSELEDKINSHKVDVAGIMKEIKTYKKEMMISEKKIENLYTLVGRLKKPEESS